MKQLLYSVYDKMSGLYAAPVMFRTDIFASRSFSENLKRISEDKNVSSVDYRDLVLYKVGSLDDETGEVESLPLSVVPFEYSGSL